MKINKEELKEISKKINIDLDDNELETINESICKITDKLNEIFGEETNEDSIRTSATNNHDLEKEVNDDYEKVDMNKINNFDGTYVKIKKENNE